MNCKNRILQSIAILAVAFSVFSCVAKKKYDELNKQKSLLEVAKAECETENDSLASQIDRLKEDYEDALTKIDGLKNDTTELNKMYSDLEDQFQELSKISAADSRQLKAKLDELTQLRRDLIQKDSQLKSDQGKIDRLQQDLEIREQRVQELEAIIAKQQEAVASLKNLISDALLSFNDDELTVELKNGKIYVSLSNELLFKSGSYNVDTKGQGAITKLAEVLKDEEDLEIIVEGHTDDVPYKGSGQLKDNWDLSVKRATSIVRLLQNDGVAPQKLAASGRSEYNPRAEGDTPETRAQNRRIEVIISPNLDALFEVINE